MDDDYQYIPDSVPEPREKYSTSLQELDEQDLVARNDDANTFVVNPDSAYPNILEKPLFIKTVPERNQILPANQTNNRTKMMSGEAEHAIRVAKEKSKYQNRTIKEFTEDIAGSYIGIINDLLACRSVYDVMDVFTKDNRLVAIGILFVVVSIFFTFFKKIE